MQCQSCLTSEVRRDPVHSTRYGRQRISMITHCCVIDGRGLLACRMALAMPKLLLKADSTQRASRAVPHPSTDRALCRLTSEVRRDPVHSTRYGRQRISIITHMAELLLRATSGARAATCPRNPRGNYRKFIASCTLVRIPGPRAESHAALMPHIPQPHQLL